MRKARIIAIPLIGILLVLGACNSGGTTTPNNNPAPANPTPTNPAPASVEPTTPAPATPSPTTPAPTTPAPTTPTPTTPTPTTPAVPTGPANFVFIDMKATPTTIELEPDSAVVSVIVKNTGGQEGTTPVELKVNGKTYATKSVTLAGGTSESVTFSFMTKDEGTFTLSIGDQSAIVKCIEGAPGAG